MSGREVRDHGRARQSADTDDLRVRLSHTIDDAETLRARMTRSVTTKQRLLEEGLHALEHGSPAVTKERIEMVLDGLAADLEMLRAALERARARMS